MLAWPMVWIIRAWAINKTAVLLAFVHIRIIKDELNNGIRRGR